MDSDNMATAGAPPRTLVSALDQSEQVKHKVEECAEKLFAVNTILEDGMARHLPLERMEGALSQNQEIEDEVGECVEDLSSVKLALTKEIADREYLESELKNSKIEEKESRYHALHDALTGLPNRALFDDRLTNALAHAQRHERGIALLFIDLDGFKNINDSYGHATGDKFLCTVAERLRTSTRAADTVCRYGGDEFLCLLLDVADENHVAKIVEKIVMNISAPCYHGGVRFNVKPSIGIAMFPTDGKTAEVWIKNADAAMYVAKQNNKMNPNAAGYWFFSKVEKIEIPSFSVR
ncbi:TPA: GGDEF domain-containing protein [Enterobacter hormaechei]|uniref:GGDEF domain-containing protein n=1 Tax=Enterobacterales TaxID=91347 RepID=UPI0005EEBB90|nr:GGDEF domain-containing protein [Enterobacter hormaechei]HAI9994219.1 GGDEF domain-containing protein [Escherichia coli]HCJ7345022.1 GGDEF domain-containing protein [Enterobacter hormaechei subsp. xiangfangensis]HDL6704081.1 GGDEF domain-containing protein [Yersinia enterocolitica]ELC6359389.1 GGDEF domain-containing protein [Enterobacter hormaechei]KJN36458.1 hypothetical protein SS45_24795 [Enterobacter hormaechei subsp. steigerwaltii]